METTTTTTAAGYAAMTPAQLREILKSRGIPTSRRTSAGHGYHCPELCRKLLDGLDAGRTAAEVFAEWDAAHGITAAAPAASKPRKAAAAAKAPEPAKEEPAKTPEPAKEERKEEPAKTDAPERSKPLPGSVELREKLIAFFSEFGNFRPQARFLNQLCRTKTAAEGKAYIASYFALTGSPYAADITAKLESAEAAEMLQAFAALTPSKEVNHRLEIYYGPQGAGKSWYAERVRFPQAEKFVCKPELTADELFRRIDFHEEDGEKGKATFHEMPLSRAMREGKPVILDEINLLSREVLQSLQGFLDNTAKADGIEIKDGFKVVGTMNLEIDGETRPLPGPFVDRAEVIQAFELSPEKACLAAGM